MMNVLRQIIREETTRLLEAGRPHVPQKPAMTADEVRAGRVG